MMPRYRNGTTRVRGHIGPSHTGFWNLQRSERGSDGKFISTPNSQPIVPEAWRWGSVRRYHKEYLSGQLSSLMADVNSWIDHTNRQSADVVKEALRPTFNKSLVYVPKDTLELMQSGRLEAKTNSRNETVVSISYGSKGRPFYAVFVHEILSYRHESPTRAKYLESAVREDMGDIRARLAAGYTRVMGV